MSYRAKALRSDHSLEDILYITKDTSNGVVLMGDFEEIPFKEGSYLSRPTLRGPEAMDFMQVVMDVAYEFGLRPSAVQDEKHIKAHLSDMRDITKHLLKMDRK